MRERHCERFLNKEFHSDRIYSPVPSVVEEVQVFGNILRSIAEEGEMCFLDLITLRFTIDLIGRTTLDSLLQIQYNALADSMLAKLAAKIPMLR
jgi:hypothetical protein